MSRLNAAIALVCACLALSDSIADANGLIREHVRSIQGYVIVNPYAVRTASR